MSDLGNDQHRTPSMVDYKINDNWRETARPIVHKLAGSLGTFGFETASQTARTMELLLQSSSEAMEIIPVLLQLVAVVQAELNQPHPAEATVKPSEGLHSGLVGVFLTATKPVDPGSEYAGTGWSGIMSLYLQQQPLELDAHPVFNGATRSRNSPQNL